MQYINILKYFIKIKTMKLNCQEQTSNKINFYTRIFTYISISEREIKLT